MICQVPSEGRLSFRDSYGSLCVSEWVTAADGSFHITTTIYQKRHYGDGGYHVVDGVLYFKGLVDTITQVLRNTADGCVVISESSNQVLQSFRVFDPCERLVGKLCHYYDNELTEKCELSVSSGMRWTEPSDPATGLTWDNFQFIDVWSN